MKRLMIVVTMLVTGEGYSAVAAQQVLSPRERLLNGEPRIEYGLAPGSLTPFLKSYLERIDAEQELRLTVGIRVGTVPMLDCLPSGWEGSFVPQPYALYIQDVTLVCKD